MKKNLLIVVIIFFSLLLFQLAYFLPSFSLLILTIAITIQLIVSAIILTKYKFANKKYEHNVIESSGLLMANVIAYLIIWFVEGEIWTSYIGAGTGLTIIALSKVIWPNSFRVKKKSE
jgi:uncharacterized membrane protein